MQGGFSQKEHDWHELRPRFASRDRADTWTLELPPGTRQLINPGSAGQPRDADLAGDGFAMYGDIEAREIGYLSPGVPYDLAAAQGAVDSRWQGYWSDWQRQGCAEER